MLTWDEVKEAFEEATDLSPDDFEKVVANYVPQTIIPKMLSEVIEDFETAVDDPDQVAQMAGIFMTGFHFGWILAMRAGKS